MSALNNHYLFFLALYGKLHRHPLDVRLIDDIDARFDDAEQRSHIRAHHRKRHLGRVTHPKHFIGLSPSGGAMGYGGYGRGRLGLSEDLYGQFSVGTSGSMDPGTVVMILRAPKMAMA